jgi:hypothetical protein
MPGALVGAAEALPTRTAQEQQRTMLLAQMAPETRAARIAVDDARDRLGMVVVHHRQGRATEAEVDAADDAYLAAERRYRRLKAGVDALGGVG